MDCMNELHKLDNAGILLDPRMFKDKGVYLSPPSPSLGNYKITDYVMFVQKPILLYLLLYNACCRIIERSFQRSHPGHFVHV